jgi:hypothetical protein
VRNHIHERRAELPARRRDVSSLQTLLEMRLQGPDGKALSAWSGRKGESVVELIAAPGRYVVEIDRSAGAAARAVFGVKGPPFEGAAGLERRFSCR